MNRSIENQDLMLDAARRLVTELEAGNKEAVDQLLTEITDLRESTLFQELGKLTREFHNALNSFRYDERITSLAKEEIPDAKERLQYVIKKTDEAAHKTLNAIEAVMPVCDEMETSLKNFDTEWSRFTHREMNPDEFRQLSSQLQNYFSGSTGHMNLIRNNLNDVLMAQDFQDITGQIIKRVITLVADVEKSLVELIKLGGGVEQSPNKEKTKDKSGELEGPQVPGLESESVVSGQDEVDDLLSSLGF